MKMLYTDSKIEIIKLEAQIQVRIIGSNSPFITFKVDSHDNRLTAVDVNLEGMDEPFQRDIVANLVRVLDDEKIGFGGKEFIVVDKKIAKVFIEHGFIADFDVKGPTERVRVTTPADMQTDINLLEEKNRFAEFNNTFNFKLDHDIAKRTNDLIELMSNSGFMPEKVEDYRQKGELGLYVMCHDSFPMVLIDKESNKIIAFCRVSDLNKGYGYLADTWVNEKYFGSKALGTAYLYQKVASVCQEKNIHHLLLIAPPERVEEFDTYYGCKKPAGEVNGKVILAKFAGPKPELKLTFQEQADNMRYKLKANEQPKASVLAHSMPIITSISEDKKDKDDEEILAVKTPPNTLNVIK